MGFLEGTIYSVENCPVKRIDKFKEHAEIPQERLRQPSLVIELNAALSLCSMGGPEKRFKSSAMQHDLLCHSQFHLQQSTLIVQVG